MKLESILIFAIAGGVAGTLTVDTVTASPILLARQKPEQKTERPPKIDKTVRLSPKKLRFGMGLEDISDLYEKVFERQFVPLYKKVEPGPKMKALDAELAEKKKFIKRNHVEFGDLPSGLDNTPLGQEFTYHNGESMTHVTLRSGVKRHFFFFDDDLWKVYDIYKLGEKGRLGKSFDAVVSKLSKKFEKKPRRLDRAPDEGRRYEQADWATDRMIVRVINRPGSEAALLYIDRKVEENLDRYRSHEGDDGQKLESDVEAVTR